MFVISSRAGFDAPDTFSSLDQARPGTAERGEGRDRETYTSPLAVAERLRGRRVLVLVHGYNYALSDATTLFRTVEQTAEAHFPDAYDAVLGYTWPSGASPYDYFGAKARIGEAGRRLRRWLEALWAVGCTVDVAGHSLGVRVAAAAVEGASVFRARNVFLLAAAAGTDALEALRAAAGHAYVFYTRNDEALGRWYWLFEWETPLGYAGPSRAALADWGPDDVTVVDCTDVVPGHDQYQSSPGFADVLAELLDRPGPATETPGDASRPPAATAVEAEPAPVPERV
jgi:esterase/lipase superfamily enzyme